MRIIYKFITFFTFNFIIITEAKCQNLKENLNNLTSSSQLNFKIDTTEILFIKNGTIVNGNIGIELLKRGGRYECLIFEKVDLLFSNELNRSSNNKLKYIYLINDLPTSKR